MYVYRSDKFRILPTKWLFAGYLGIFAVVSFRQIFVSWRGAREASSLDFADDGNDLAGAAPRARGRPGPFGLGHPPPVSVIPTG
jgi:hypothetical protein